MKSIIKRSNILYVLATITMSLYSNEPPQKTKKKSLIPFVFEEYLSENKEKEDPHVLPTCYIHILPDCVVKNILVCAMSEKNTPVNSAAILSCVCHAFNNHIKELKTASLKKLSRKTLDKKTIDKETFGAGSLHLAACKDKYPILDLLIQQVGNLNKRDSKKNTPLHVALAHGCNVNAAKLAVNPKVDIGLQNQYGDTPLHLAVKNHKINIANVMLLLKHGASLDVKNNEGKTPLDVAFGQKLKLLEKKKAKKLKEMFLQTLARGKEIVPPLHFAVQHNNAWWVNQLIDEGAHLGLTDASGKTSLHVAVEKNHVKIFQLLLERGGSLNVKDKKGNSLLYTAVLYNRLPIARYLIKKGAQIDEKNNNDMTSLHLAVLHRKRGMIDLLINNGAPLNARTKGTFLGPYYVHGFTPLHIAVGKNFTELIPLLIGENNQYIQAKTVYEKTPLHVAVRDLSEEAIKMLLQRGANANEVDKEGYNSLETLIRSHFNKINSGNAKILRIAQELCSYGARYRNHGQFGLFASARNFSILEFILENGANIEHRFSRGKTLLHRAAQEGNYPLVVFLLGHGAAVNVRNNNNLTPLHFAAISNNVNIARVLLDHGADIRAQNNSGERPIDVAHPFHNKALYGPIFRKYPHINKRIRRFAAIRALLTVPA